MNTPQLRPTVFVVDADLRARATVTCALQAAGFDVASYASAEAFLAQFDPARPGCLLAEIRLPGMSGLHLQAELHRRRIRLPLVFLTGHADVPTAVKAIQGGAVDFLRKPADGERIRTAIMKALGGG